MEQIKAAMNEALETVLGDRLQELNEEEQQKLVTFMDFTAADPDPSIRYLKEFGWSVQEAAEQFWRDNPDKAASRPASYVFNQSEVDQINADYDPNDGQFEVQLPDDIDPDYNRGKKRRGSNELNAVPNGVRDTDDEEEDEEQDTINEKLEEKESEIGVNGNAIHMLPGNNILTGNGYGNDADSSHDDEDPNDGTRSEQALHERMDTNQQVMVGTLMSKAQLEFDHSMEEMRADKERIEKELKQVQGEKDEIERKYGKLAASTDQLQQDWDQMCEYMNKILTEINYVEDERSRGKEIAVPTSELSRLITEVRKIYAEMDR